MAFILKKKNKKTNPKLFWSFCGHACEHIANLSAPCFTPQEMMGIYLTNT